MARVEKAWASLGAALEHADTAGAVLVEREAERDAAAAHADGTGRQVQEAKARVGAADLLAGGA
ncbi:hypothetical protein ACWGKU_20370 [Kitasatospora sp. NPDC054768]